MGLYRHPEDIELPEPARATIAGMAWLADAWTGMRGTSSTEERWSPPQGGAMLGVSRTVRGEKMTGFEYLRIVERDGGLVYVAQPGGRSPTEFVLTELENQRAEFVNPRHDYPQRICERHRNLTLGLLWFLQNDDEIPDTHRAIARQYHLPRDEFTDNGHFPFHLYVREARRLIGEYTLTEHDMTSPCGEHFDHADAIAVGEFPIDSFPCRRRQPGDTVVLEGYLGMLDSITQPYGIPYRIMIPKSIDGLIVPVAASTTHVAYSSIRMEPTWMALGQAAGVAAHLATQLDVEPRAVPLGQLQSILKNQGQVLQHAGRQLSTEASVKKNPL